MAKEARVVVAAVDCASRFASHYRGNRSQSLAQHPIMFMQETSSASRASNATRLNAMTIRRSSSAA
ncbi:hypothetical protein [Longimicrobium sp.]|uniref:hypothetical protein n=1 Tax=Longimicrobium sp. TaxID=2029185 RepID=UPI002ED87FD6